MRGRGQRRHDLGGFRTRTPSARTLPAVTTPRSLSVVLCAYTLERWDDICAAVESLRVQTHPVAQVVLVADHNDELLARAWEALAETDASPGRALYTVLRFRVDHPDMRSASMAEALAERLGKDLTAAGVRQTLHRARSFARPVQTAPANSLHHQQVSIPTA